jgi:hypothetical protein
MSRNRESSENTVKVTSKHKEVIDEIIDYLRTGFECTITSPKMYNEEKDQFFQFVDVQRRA